MLFSNLLLALSSSIDSFGIGITYGLRNIKFSKFSYVMLLVISFITTSFSITIGNQISKFMSPIITTLLGSFLLILMGIVIIFQVKNDTKSKYIISNSPKIYNFFIKYFGITIQIIKNPISSDLDHSDSIDIKEAFYLGTTLSIDSFCIGIGSSIIGVNSLIFPVLVSTFQILFLFAGKFFSRLFKAHILLPENCWNLLSGILLITIGLLKLFF